MPTLRTEPGDLVKVFSSHEWYDLEVVSESR